MAFGNILDGTFLSDTFSGQSELPYVFITHYHSDHLTGLAKGNKRYIISSPLTARYLHHIDKVRHELLYPVLPYYRHILPEGLSFSACPANHCPGSYLFSFQYKGSKILYTGDFRFNDEIEEWLREQGEFDLVYADDTYYSPRQYKDNDFPPQEEVLESITTLVLSKGNRDILIGTYTIGKEKVLKAVSDALQMPVYVPEKHIKYYKIQGLDYFTSDKQQTRIMGYRIGYLTNEEWTRGISVERHMVIIPTAMTFYFRKREGYYYIPYSEHCNNTEFRRFLSIVYPSRVISLNTGKKIDYPPEQLDLLKG